MKCFPASRTVSTLNRLPLLLALLAGNFLLAFSTPSVFSAITTTGNINPDLPWTGNLVGFVGYTANGTLTIDGGSIFNSGWDYRGKSKLVNQRGSGAR